MKGEQDLANIGKQGDIDVSKIGAQGDVDIKKIGATGSEERKSQDNAQKNTMRDRKDQSNYARGLANMF